MLTIAARQYRKHGIGPLYWKLKELPATAVDEALVTEQRQNMTDPTDPHDKEPRP